MHEEKCEPPVFTATRTVALRCKRVAFGRERAWARRDDVEVGVRDVRLVVESDGDTTCITFEWVEDWAVLYRQVKRQRVFHAADITCMKWHATYHGSSIIRRPCVVITISACAML